MTKKIISVIIIVVVMAAVMIFVGLMVRNKSEKDSVITSAQLVKAIDTNELSTAEFVYNGVAEKHEEDNPEEVECYIAYNANVKVGIQMEDVEFNIDEDKKTVTPILPEIVVNVASLDEDAISYIPKNPDISLKEIITLCKEDVINEANNSKKLYQTAEENLKAVIEALLRPILKNAEYTIVW